MATLTLGSAPLKIPEWKGSWRVLPTLRHRVGVAGPARPGIVPGTVITSPAQVHPSTAHPLFTHKSLLGQRPMGLWDRSWGKMDYGCRFTSAETGGHRNV